MNTPFLLIWGFLANESQVSQADTGRLNTERAVQFESSQNVQRLEKYRQGFGAVVW